DIVPLLVFRNKQNIIVKAKLSGDDNKTDNNTKDNKQDNKRNSNDIIKLDKFGITITNLDGATKKQLNINGGVVVTSVENVAQMAGILQGDVILSVNNQDITNADQVKSILKDKNLAAFLVLRDNQRMYITLSVG
ncbi:MAG: PDZ domain-containing protein, partial [Burkholderiales bacterium]|nr:PDZ domain-containing protein [Burkholderiales bacterium]